MAINALRKYKGFDASQLTDTYFNDTYKGRANTGVSALKAALPDNTDGLSLVELFDVGVKGMPKISVYLPEVHVGGDGESYTWTILDNFTAEHNVSTSNGFILQNQLTLPISASHISNIRLRAFSSSIGYSDGMEDRAYDVGSYEGATINLRHYNLSSTQSGNTFTGVQTIGDLFGIFSINFESLYGFIANINNELQSIENIFDFGAQDADSIINSVNEVIDWFKDLPEEEGGALALVNSLKGLKVNGKSFWNNNNVWNGITLTGADLKTNADLTDPKKITLTSGAIASATGTSITSTTTINGALNAITGSLNTTIDSIVGKLGFTASNTTFTYTALSWSDANGAFTKNTAGNFGTTANSVSDLIYNIGTAITQNNNAIDEAVSYLVSKVSTDVTNSIKLSSSIHKPTSYTWSTSSLTGSTDASDVYSIGTANVTTLTTAISNLRDNVSHTFDAFGKATDYIISTAIPNAKKVTADIANPYTLSYVDDGSGYKLSGAAGTAKGVATANTTTVTNAISALKTNLDTSLESVKSIVGYIQGKQIPDSQTITNNIDLPYTIGWNGTTHFVSGASGTSKGLAQANSSTFTSAFSALRTNLNTSITNIYNELNYTTNLSASNAVSSYTFDESYNILNGSAGALWNNNTHIVSAINKIVSHFDTNDGEIVKFVSHINELLETHISTNGVHVKHEWLIV